MTFFQMFQLVVGIAAAALLTVMVFRNASRGRPQMKLLRAEQGGTFVGPESPYLNFLAPYLIGYLGCLVMAISESPQIGSLCMLIPFLVSSAKFQFPLLLRFNDDGFTAVTASGQRMTAAWDEIQASTHRAGGSYTLLSSKGRPTLAFRHSWPNADRLYAKLREMPESKLSGVFP